MTKTYLLLSVFIPLLGSFFLWILNGKVRNVLTLLLTLTSFISTCFLISPIVRGEIIEVNIPVFDLELFTLSFIGDGLALIFAMIFSLIGLIAIVYSFDYMKGYPHQREYYSMSVLMIGSLLGIAFSRNLILLYVFWEIASLTTWRLVGFYRKEEVTYIANKTFLMIFGSSSFMLLGFIMIYSDLHTFDMVVLRNYSIDNFVLFLIFIGIVAKAAVLPIHTWLPDAHTVAPSPISGLLSGIVVKIGLLAFVRIFIWTFHTSWDWILILTALSSIVAASGALIESDMKKIIAYSTVSQICFIMFGFAVYNEIGIAAGLLYFIVHAIGKAGLFLCAGIVEHQCKERNINELGGLIKSMPLTGIAFAFCALTIIGMPPYGGFYSKLLVITAVVSEGYYWIAFLAIFSAILTLLYLLRLFRFVFLGKSRFVEVKEGSKIMVTCVLLLGILSLAIGLFIDPILTLINVALLNIF